MEITYEKQAIKALRRMPVKTAQLIRSKIIAFANGETNNIDIKPLKGTDNGFRIRQGDWRVIMTADYRILRVIKIKARGDVYK